MEKKETQEEKVNYIEQFLNSFLLYHYSRNSLMFDISNKMENIYNIENFYKLSYFACDYWYEFVKEKKVEIDWNKVTKSNFFEQKRIIEEFFKSLGINFDFDKIINDGTLYLIPYEDLDHEYCNENHYIMGRAGKHNNHKYIDGFNNGLITDSIVWVHEITHYQNESNHPETQERALLTESLSFAIEFIYINYLNKLGYTYESETYKIDELINLYRHADKSIPLLRLYILFINYGNIKESSYREYFNGDDYQMNINYFYNEISKDEDIIFRVTRYAIALSLSTYLYEEYLKDNRFLDKIKLLNESLKEEKDIRELLNIVDLSIHNNIIDKFTKSFDELKSEIEEYQNTKKLTKN